MTTPLPLSGHQPVLNEARGLTGCTCGWPASRPMPDSRTAFIMHCLEILGADTTPREEGNP